MKPVDVGNGHLVASLAASRPALLSVTCYQQEHGVAELSALPPFDESARGNPDAVRRYRRLMASDEFPCLWLEHGESLAADALVVDGTIMLVWRVAPNGVARAPIRFRGRLDRPALAEITELDPPQPTGATTGLSAEGSRLVVRSTLPAAMAFDSSTGEWVIDGDEASLELGSAQDVTLRVSRLDHLPRGRERASGPPALDVGVPAEVARIVDRALAYTRGCAAINTAPDRVAILADHRLLPLSWTRDAYYQALLLLATDVAADTDLVADHLRWLWLACERPDGRWLRSHHANGRPKDHAFQADQQLYPLLELADYWRARRELPAGVDWALEVRRAWAATVAQIDQATGLIATAENAADDPAVAPYVAASQILLWYACVRLAELTDAGDLAIDSSELRAVAAAAREGFDRHLIEDGMWLYSTDTQATRIRYHDANDLPVALAPLLGFCASDDAGWRRTMDFAFSAANPGFFAGERGGLGSAHTPAAWTLGDIQSWIRARIADDRAAMAAATARLADVAFQDAMLPEAYSTTLDPDIRIRHWFAWPGAAFGALLMLDARGALERLRALRRSPATRPAADS